MEGPSATNESYSFVDQDNQTKIQVMFEGKRFAIIRLEGADASALDAEQVNDIAKEILKYNQEMVSENVGENSDGLQKGDSIQFKGLLRGSNHILTHKESGEESEIEFRCMKIYNTIIEIINRKSSKQSDDPSTGGKSKLQIDMEKIENTTHMEFEKIDSAAPSEEQST